jgi:hypothetical protein
MNTNNLLKDMEARNACLAKQINRAGLVGNDRITKLNRQVQTAGLASQAGTAATWPNPQTGLAAGFAKAMERSLPDYSAGIASVWPKPQTGLAAGFAKAMERSLPDYSAGIASVWPKPQTGLAAGFAKAMEGMLPKPGLVLGPHGITPYSSVVATAMEDVRREPWPAFDSHRLFPESTVSKLIQDMAARMDALAAYPRMQGHPVVALPEVGDVAAEVGVVRPAESAWTWPDTPSLDDLKLGQQFLAVVFWLVVNVMMAAGYEYVPISLVAASNIERAVGFALLLLERRQNDSDD